MRLLSKGSMRSKRPRMMTSHMPRVHRMLRGRSGNIGGGMRRKLFRG